MRSNPASSLTWEVFPVVVRDDVLPEVGVVLPAHHAHVLLEGQVIVTGYTLEGQCNLVISKLIVCCLH